MKRELIRQSTMKLLTILLVLFSFSAFGQSEAYEEMLKKYYTDFPTISCSKAARMVNTENVYFLDTREQKEFNVSHINGAKCVGYDQFKLSAVKDIPKDATIIVYCSIGARSQTIGEKLVKAGYKDVRNLYGGFFQWSNSGLPKYTSNRKLTDKIHGYSKEWGKWITKGVVVY